MKKTSSDFYTTKEIADMFKRPEFFTNKLFEMGLPSVTICRKKKVFKNVFWNWIGIKEPDDPKMTFITVREMAAEIGISYASAYRMVSRLPYGVVLKCGAQYFVFKERLYDWLSKTKIA